MLITNAASFSIYHEARLMMKYGDCTITYVGCKPMTDEIQTTGWQPIETAPQDYDGDPIMVAHFRDHDRLPVYAVMVSWASAMPGYTHCASYSGWFVHCLPTENPPRRRGINVVSDEILARTEMAPTHWRPM